MTDIKVCHPKLIEESYLVYIPNIIVAIVKYTIKLRASTMVVISGPAIIAGSNFIFFAINGSVPPTTFDAITVTIKVNDTAIAILVSTCSMNINLKKLINDKATPTIKLILNSLNNTFGQSEVFISPVAKPLITKVED